MRIDLLPENKKAKRLQGEEANVTLSKSTITSERWIIFRGKIKKRSPDKSPVFLVIKMVFTILNST